MHPSFILSKLTSKARLPLFETAIGRRKPSVSVEARVESVSDVPTDGVTNRFIEPELIHRHKKSRQDALAARG
jgi:hypothetical protein